jgi:hypothetical protein
MARRSVGFVVLAVLAAAVGVSEAMTLSVSEANIVELLQQSNDIVVGHVNAVTDGIDEHGIPYTEVTLNVSEAIRGGASGIYTFRQFGLLAPRLTPDGKRKMMPAPPGFPKYEQGEDLLLLLRPSAAWTGFRMPAGVTQGKFTISAGRAENGMGNAGLFRDVNLDQGLVQERDKRLLTTAGGPVNPDALVSFVRRAVQDRWIESGRMSHAGRPKDPRMPPPSEVGGAQGPQPAAQPPAANPQTAPLDPRTNITLPRSSR